MTWTLSPAFDVKFDFAHSTSGASEIIFMKFFSAQFARHRPKYARAARVEILVDNHDGIIVKAEDRSRPAASDGMLVRTTTARTTSPF